MGGFELRAGIIGRLGWRIVDNRLGSARRYGDVPACALSHIPDGGSISIPHIHSGEYSPHNSRSNTSESPVPKTFVSRINIGSAISGSLDRLAIEFEFILLRSRSEETDDLRRMSPLRTKRNKT